TFGTDSSGDIVSWNFEVVAFLSLFSPPETKGIQTENDSGNVVDSGNLDQPSGIVGEGSVTADPGVCVGGNNRAGAISRFFICLVRGVGFGIRAVQAIAASSILGK